MIGRASIRLMVMVLALGLGCGRSGAANPDKVAVFAASSLTEAFSELERSFEASHPGTDVQLTFAGSQVLRLQIEQGAPADVFASANQAHVDALAAAGHCHPGERFARNDLVVIVPRSNPAKVDAFTDLAAAERIVVGTQSVPIGAYTRDALDLAASELGNDFAATVRARIVSEENNARLVRAKVELGEADAAFVYRTDATATDAVTVVEIPAAINVHGEYWIAASNSSAHAETARLWIEHVQSPAGQKILAEHGFTTEP